MFTIHLYAVSSVLTKHRPVLLKRPSMFALYTHVPYGAYDPHDPAEEAKPLKDLTQIV